MTTRRTHASPPRSSSTALLPRCPVAWSTRVDSAAVHAPDGAVGVGGESAWVGRALMSHTCGGVLSIASLVRSTHRYPVKKPKMEAKFAATLARGLTKQLTAASAKLGSASGAGDQLQQVGEDGWCVVCGYSFHYYYFSFILLILWGHLRLRRGFWLRVPEI